MNPNGSSDKENIEVRGKHFKGLTDKEVLESREKYGSNVIPESEPTTFWAEFKETFNDPMHSHDRDVLPRLCRDL